MALPTDAHNPASMLGQDTVTNQPDQIKSTSGAVHVRDAGVGVMQAASVDVNDALVADVDAAVAAATGLRLMGFACRESHATVPVVATFKIVHGATVGGGTVMIPVELAASESKGPFWFGPDGLDAVNGLSIDWVVGTVDVELFHKTVT